MLSSSPHTVLVCNRWILRVTDSCLIVFARTSSSNIIMFISGGFAYLFGCLGTLFLALSVEARRSVGSIVASAGVGAQNAAFVASPSHVLMSFGANSTRISSSMGAKSTSSTGEVSSVVYSDSTTSSDPSVDYIFYMLICCISASQYFVDRHG